MSGTWELIALTPAAPKPKKKRFASKVNSPISKWNVNSDHSTLHTSVFFHFCDEVAKNVKETVKTVKNY
jgi:hypothetical protein